MSKKSDLIYGIRTVIEAVRSGEHPERVVVQKNLKGELYKTLMLALHRTKIPISKVPAERINKFTRKNHQGVVALISPIKYQSIENLVPSLFEKGKNPLLLILDEITDVRNLGSIARTAECLGAHGIIIPVKGGAQVNKDAVKTSSGAFNYLPVCRESDLKACVSYLRESGIRIISCAEKTDNLLSNEDFTGPTALIIGSEAKGINAALLKQSDAICKIKMQGRIKSLNVSAATGMALYEIQAQRTK